MNRTALLLWIVGALTLSTPGLEALEVQEGNIRLVLHENSSRFTLSLRQGPGWTPLFFEEDPRTSGLDILEGNRVHRMGDGGAFQQDVESIEGGARFVWTSPTLEVVQSFRLTQGVRAERFNAVEMVVRVTNRGEEPATVGARMLFDTYLGERANVHFTTPGSDQITRERSLEPGPVNRYVASVPGAQAAYGFQVMLQGEGLTVPQAAIVANWKRLSDASWDYEVNRTRNFNRLPYSINDSALLVLYETEQLESGQSYEITSRFGDLAPEGYLPADLAAETTGADPLLARLSELLVQINELIGSEDVDPEVVAELQAELETLSNLIRGR